jgi:hypothetical protein
MLGLCAIPWLEVQISIRPRFRQLVPGHSVAVPRSHLRLLSHA